jgi:DNA-binding SARP family transcriptional activator/predicted ATPase/Tfp pilus assembly protein PilF
LQQEIMAQLSISLLGSFQVALAGRPVSDLGTDKARGLLAYLAVEANRTHRRDALTGLLWAESPQPRARQSLRQALSHLRQALGDGDRDVPFLLVTRETVRFNPEGEYWLDVAEFTALGEANRTHRHRHIEQCLPCLQRMEKMAALYGGSFLGGFFLGDSHAFEEWAVLQREYLQRQVMDALTCLVEYYERRGSVRLARDMAHRQVEIEPWREEVHRELMRLLALDGQRSAALAQYRACRQALARELGVEPAAETTALYEQIEGHGHQRVESSWPGVRASRQNLPLAPTPFVGREEELAALAELLADPDCRLVTITGPGGIGKTRLALQAAAGQVGLFAHGVTFVPLAAITSAELLAPALADALLFRFRSQGDPEGQLLDYLREKEMLLVLDNMEQVLAGSDLVARILDQASAVLLLVTSRERLNLREEWVYEIGGLARPVDPAAADLESYSAVALFVATARRAHRTFLLTEPEGTHVARICTMVEGMPLAVELAAAWIPVRTCEEVVTELEHNLDTLATPLRNMPPRHQSLRAAFEHSWGLLSEPEHAALCQLSLFQAGFGGEAARRVACAPPEVLDSLTAKSLLRRDAAGRYDMHRLIQQYASEKLEALPHQQQAVEGRYCTYYGGLLREWSAWFRDRRQTEALAAIAAEIQNVRLAWRLAAARGQVEALAGSLASMGGFYAIRSWNREGATAFGQVVERLAISRPAANGGADPFAARQRDLVLGAALAWQGYFLCQLGRYDEARELLGKSLEILRPIGATNETAFALYTMAQLLFSGQNDYGEAKKLFQESLAQYEVLGDRYGQAQALDGLGDVAARQGLHSEAHRCYEAGLTLRREIGDLWGISISLGSLGGLAGRQGAYDEARQWFEESLSIARDLDNPQGIAASLHNLSTVAYLQGDYAQARRLRLETLAICRDIGYRWGVASALKSLGDVAGRLGAYDEARQYLLESLGILEAAGDRRSRAYTLNSLGTVTRAMGHFRESWRYFQNALEAAMEIREPPLALDILGSIAELAAQAGDIGQAVELVAFVLHHPASEQQTRAQMDPLRAALRARLSEQAVAIAEARCRALDLDGVATKILQEGQ